MNYEVIVIGSSWGGFHAVGSILSGLPSDFEVPLVIAQHQSPSFDGDLGQALAKRSALPIGEVNDKTPLERGHVYIAPPDYHTLIDGQGLALSTDEHVNFSRPSIDVLFESAADAFGPAVIGVVLTGANRDGADGLARIKANGGYSIVEDPKHASQPVMPQAAIDAAHPHEIALLDQIPVILIAKTSLGSRQRASS